MITSLSVSQQLLFRRVFCWTLCLLVVVSAGTVSAADSNASRDSSQLLQDRAVQFMQLVNAARRDPLAAAEQLGVKDALVHSVFAETPWILEQGLPPLAWNNLLVSSASTHGRDMFNRLYYSYVTPEGETVEQRIAAAGFQAISSGERMNALFFTNFVSLNDAFNILVAAMLRDELSGESAAERVIFSSDVTELGVAFFAETIEQLDGHPYVYLLLADFAAPMDEQQYVIIEHDSVNRVFFHLSDEDYWIFPRLLRPGLTQMPSPKGEGELVVFDTNSSGGATAAYTAYTLYDQDEIDNRYFDLHGHEGY